MYLAGRSSFDSAYYNSMNWLALDCHNRIDLDTISLDTIVMIVIAIVMAVILAGVCFAVAHPMDNQRTPAFVELIVASLALVEMIVAFVALNQHWPVFGCPMAHDSVLCYCFVAVVVVAAV